MEGWRQQTITKHPDTRGSFASGIRPQHRPWGAPHCSLGISFPIAPLITLGPFATRPQPRPRGALHCSLGISVPIAPLINRGQLQPRPWGAVHRSPGISFPIAPLITVDSCNLVPGEQFIAPWGFPLFQRPVCKRNVSVKNNYVCAKAISCDKLTS